MTRGSPLQTTGSEAVRDGRQVSVQINTKNHIRVRLNTAVQIQYEVSVDGRTRFVLHNETVIGKQVITQAPRLHAKPDDARALAGLQHGHHLANHDAVFWCHAGRDMSVDLIVRNRSGWD